MTARRSANLLLVDDDPGLLKLLGMRLSSEGFRVSTAESGPEALKVLNKEKSIWSSATCGWMKWMVWRCLPRSRKPIPACR